MLSPTTRRRLAMQEIVGLDDPAHCAIASLWLASSALAFQLQAAGLGSTLALGFVATALIPTFTDFCVPSCIYALLFGGGRTAADGRAPRFLPRRPWEDLGKVRPKRTQRGANRQ